MLRSVLRNRRPLSAHRARWLLVSALLSSLAAVGCGGEHSTTVRIGYLPIYVDLPLFVAKSEGFFDRHGVNVELVRFAQSPDLATALQTGDVKVGASVAFAVILSNESRDAGKLKAFIIDSENEKDYLSSFVTLPKSGIRSIGDLRGKKVGSFPGPQAMTFCRLLLEKNGLSPDKDLELVELQSSSHLSALQSGTVDALFTYEPIATQAVLQIGAIKFLPAAVESQILSPWQAGAWVMSTKFAAEDATQARKVVSALYDAIDFIRADPLAAKKSLDIYTSIPPGVAERTPNIPFAKLGEVDTVAMQKHADILLKAGVISKPVKASSILAPTAWLTAATK